MKYLILIYGDEAAWAAMTPAETEKMMGAYRAYSQALVQAGKMVEGSELAPKKTAKNITVRMDAARVLDGPYADIREQLGGFYLIEVANEAEALDWAKKCPGAAHGGVELRLCI